MNIIYKRRSIRSYNDKEISKEDLLDIVKAGMNAPSAKNQRPSEFIIIDDKAVLNELSLSSVNMFMLNKCNKAIVVIGKETTEFFEQDLAASTQNILLEATYKNIGSCWMGVYPNKSIEDNFRNILNVDNEYHILSVVSLGYTDKDKEENNYYNEEKIYYNKFN